MAAVAALDGAAALNIRRPAQRPLPVLSATRSPFRT
jgi:hypothetical protein